MVKICPNCKQSFECCANDISKCHCIAITIDSKTLELLKDDFDDCLCGDCLVKMEHLLPNNSKFNDL